MNSSEQQGSLPDQVCFDPSSGLVPAVVQSADDDSVLMLGYMNREALERTVADERVTFYSRSRSRLWQKGETSGNWLQLIEVRVDCDGDALLLRAVPHGPTCHKGEETCFESGLVWALPASRSDGSTQISESLGSVLATLLDVISQRDKTRPPGSYTAALLERGSPRAAQKVIEEAAETALAAVVDRPQLAAESADLLYHLLVLWQTTQLDPREVAEELASRRRDAQC